MDKLSVEIVEPLGYIPCKNYGCLKILEDLVGEKLMNEHPIKKEPFSDYMNIVFKCIRDDITNHNFFHSKMHNFFHSKMLDYLMETSQGFIPGHTEEIRQYLDCGIIESLKAYDLLSDSACKKGTCQFKPNSKK